MNRKRAIFKGSRLYRQALEGSARLVTVLSADQNVFAEAIREISDSGKIVIADSQDMSRWVRAADQHASRICRQLSPEITVPVLVQAIMNHYYGGNRESPSLGRFLKRTLELVARNVFYSHAVESKAIARIVSAVRATALLSQLQELSYIFEEFSEDGDQVIFEASGRTGSPTLTKLINRFTEPMPSHERAMRTLSSTIDAIWRSPLEAMHATEQVLNGDDPKHQPPFQGTFLGELSADEPKEFWAGIWSRLNLMLYSNAIRQLITEDPLSIAIFEPFRVKSPNGLNRDLLQLATSEMFWDRDWYFQTLNDQPTNLIVERPVVRVSNNPTLLCTSLLLIGDSLNWFIENAIVSSPRSRVKLSSNVFRRLVSEPFEDSVNELFRLHGFLAGRVLGNGTWTTRNGPVFLEHSSKSIMPGEIDVLAFHEPSGAVVIIECKVISGPSHINSIRNISRKLGPLDQEEFHAKLENKIEWIRGANFFRDLPEDSFLGLIVLDVKMRWVPLGKYAVVDFADLTDFMSQVVKIETLRSLK
jgi:hypothetical protein